MPAAELDRVSMSGVCVTGRYLSPTQAGIRRGHVMFTHLVFRFFLSSALMEPEWLDGRIQERAL